MRVQVRIEIDLTLEEYVAHKGWEQARLLRCPLHPEGGCGFAAHGSYLRRYPVPHRIARSYCRKGQTTFGLLPDFAASGVPGTLLEIEEVVAVYESVGSIYRAADIVRPLEMASEEEEPLTLAATAQWVRRRVAWVQVTLVTLAGLLPELFAGCPLSLSGFRARLHSDSVLMALREICAVELEHLPSPLGFGARPKSGKTKIGAFNGSDRSNDGASCRKSAATPQRWWCRRNYPVDVIELIPHPTSPGYTKTAHTTDNYL